MKKIKRPKLVREWYENQLAKCERRIMKIAENAYLLRQVIEQFDAQEAASIAENTTKESLAQEVTENALHTTDGTGQTGIRTADRDSGESKLSDNDVIEAVLGEQ